MYTTLVLVAGKMLRGYFAGSALKIMFDDLPNVDRILQVRLIYLCIIFLSLDETKRLGEENIHYESYLISYSQELINILELQSLLM